MQFLVLVSDIIFSRTSCTMELFTFKGLILLHDMKNYTDFFGKLRLSPNDTQWMNIKKIL